MDSSSEDLIQRREIDGFDDGEMMVLMMVKAKSRFVLILKTAVSDQVLC